MGKSWASVFDVIIAGWGLVVSPSRLKWKIALHILANTSAASRVRPTHKHLLIPPPPYPCLSGRARLLGRRIPFSSPNPSVWFLFQPSLLRCCVEYWEWFVVSSPVEPTLLGGERCKGSCIRPTARLAESRSRFCTVVCARRARFKQFQ